jgi:hypothetical protein
MRLALLVLLAGCGPKLDDGDASAESSSSTVHSASSSSTGTATSSTTANTASSTDASSSDTSPSEPSTSESSTSAGPGPLCEIDDHYMCDEVPWECFEDPWSMFHCGAPTSWFDENGCLRESCDETGSCAAGFECFSPDVVCGICLSPRPFCEETKSSSGYGCSCGQDGSCGSRVCVPAELLEGDPCPQQR